MRDLEALSAFSPKVFIGLEIKDGQVRIRHRAPADIGSFMLAEPILYGLPLIRHPVCGNDRILHNFARERAYEPLLQTMRLFLDPPII